jgi:hypothetical protein
MGTALATGQAAGVAAALYAARNGSEPLAEEVREVLRLNGALLDRENLPIVRFLGSADT